MTRRNGEVADGVRGSDDFWNLNDMMRPAGCPEGDASGKMWVGTELVDPGHTPSERDGGLFGGKDCRELSRRVYEQTLAAFRKGGIG